MSRRADREEAAHLQYETEHTQPPKSRSVIVYMVILVAAAFCLLLLAYIMQERTASTVEGLQEGLHESVSSLQTIDQLVDDNRALQEEVDRLKEEYAALEDKLAETQAQVLAADSGNTVLTGTLQATTRKLQALNALNQIRALYNSGNYKAARAVVEEFPYDFDLETVLGQISREDLTDQDRDAYDPLASYQRIAKLLGY